MSMNGGGYSNARPGGDYQAPLTPTTNRVGESIKPEKWDEVLQYLRTVLQENAKLNEALQDNNAQVESIIRQKDDEIKAAQKLHWDVRISVLGFKSKIMMLTSEIEKLRGKNGGDGDSAEVNELKIKIRELEEKKEFAEVSASQLRDDLSSLQSQIANLQSANNRATNRHEQEQRNLLQQILELEEDLKKKSHSPPQPKPRANIQPRPDGRIAQLETERDHYRVELDKYRLKAEEERSSRQQAEQIRMKLENDLNMKIKDLKDTRYEKSQMEGKIRNLEARINQQSRERPNDVSIAVGAGAGGARRMLNQVLEDKNRIEAEVIQLKDKIKDFELQVLDKDRQCHDALKDNMRLKESNKKQSTDIEQLTQQLNDTNYHLNQKIDNLEEEARRMKDQLQNLNEKHHKIQVDYSKALSQLKSKQEKSTKEDWEQLNQIEELMNTLEKKDNEIQELQHTITQFSNTESERDRIMERLKRKEADCKNYLDQMETWRLQYETAQSDFAQERAVREKEAIAVKTLKDNRDALQKEIGELRKRVTDQRIIIANLQSSSSYVPESYTKEINIGMASPQGENLSPSVNAAMGRKPSHDAYNKDTGHREHLHSPRVTDQEPSVLRRDDHGLGGMGYKPKPDVPGVIDQKDFRRNFDPPATDSKYRHIPDPYLGAMPPPDPPNQLNNPPPIVTQAGQGVVGGGSSNTPTFQSPPANAFPQFAAGKQEMPRGGWPLGGDRFDLPGEVQKMEAPVIDNCPICGRSGFRTQTDLEVHAAKCG